MNQNLEIFKPIVGYENYLISNLGNLKYNNTIRYIKKSKDKQGYETIGLTDKNKKSKNFKVHKLVAECFIPNINNKKIIVHLDNNKSNNNINNLKWKSIQEHNRERENGIRNIDFDDNKLKDIQKQNKELKELEDLEKELMDILQ